MVLWVHDELVACCRPEIAAEVGAIMVRQAVEPAAFYGFKTPLAAEFKIGPSWAGEPENKNTDTAPMGEDHPPSGPPVPDSEEDEDADNEAQSITQADIDEINAGLKREGTAEAAAAASVDTIEVASPALAAAIADMTVPVAGGTKADDHAENDGDFAYHPGHSGGSRSDDYSPKHAGEPYIDAHLRGKGYVLAKVFPYELPDGTKLYEERRYELRPGITPTKERPHKTSRFCNTVNGADLFDTGPRRIIYNWPAIMRAGPDATVHVTEGANKSASLNAAGLLATAVAYHQWTPECVAALAGRHLIYHEDHDDNGRKFSAEARKHLAPVARASASCRRSICSSSSGKSRSRTRT
jgi:hypothetical protein